MKAILTLLCLLLSLQAEHTLDVKVTNIRKEKGTVVVALFNDQNHYQSTKGIPLQTLSKRAQKPSTTVTFLNLPTGEYTLKVYQDRNLDGKLDRNAFNTPKEPHAFSNNHYWDIFQPEYELVKFRVESDTLHTVKLK